MTPDLRTPAGDLLTSIAQPQDVRQQACAVGAVQRQGRVDSYALLMVVVLGLVVRGRVSIAQLGQINGDVTGPVGWRGRRSKIGSLQASAPSETVRICRPEGAARTMEAMERACLALNELGMTREKRLLRFEVVPPTSTEWRLTGSIWWILE